MFSIFLKPRYIRKQQRVCKIKKQLFVISQFINFWINFQNKLVMRQEKILILITLLLIATLCQTLQDTLDCLNSYMQTFQSKMDPKLFSMFKASYPNTLTTTVQHFDLTPGNESTYIITGDIEAMWLRDSTNQFLPYMKITKQCPKIRELARGLLNTQAQLIMVDAYTNAFKKFEDNIQKRHFYLNDKTQTLFFGIPVDLSRNRQFATRYIWERKFQIDSLASFLRLAYEYQQRYKSIDFVNLRFIKALKRILRTVEEQTKDLLYQSQTKTQFYTFYRIATELRQGKIANSFGTGMIKTGFRPSDDPNDYPYNIPGNAMFSTFLSFVAKEVLSKIPQNSVFKAESNTLIAKMLAFSDSIKGAIMKYGVVKVDTLQIFAYQVNGKGQSKTFDDANLPSLLSLPYLKFINLDHPIYINTRKHLLSRENPYYYETGQIKGIGSSHTPAGNIWPLALITQVLTTKNKDEIRNCLKSLKAHSFDNLNHESFSSASPTAVTRNWFAWANSFFGEMIITLSQQSPETIQ